jgi:hypothetical protein
MRTCILVGIGSTLLLLGDVGPSQAIDIVIDYTYDTNDFFTVGSPARSTIEAVADFYSEILDDTFSPISTPPPLVSSLPPEQNPGTAYWEWTMLFNHPSAAGQVTLLDETIEADEYRIYVGAKNLPGDAIGQGGTGGRGWRSYNDGGYFTTEEVDQINAITAAFSTAVTTRGEPGGFAAWGGRVSFDLDASVNWHFDHTTPPVEGENDLLSVAIHEIGHALGLGGSSAWTALTTGSGDAALFTGAAASAVYGGYVPLAYNLVEGIPVADKAHWREGIASTVFGSAAAQEAAMDPSLTVGTRKRLTALDAAALTDIGWTVLEPILPGDYNDDGTVNAADYTVWRNSLGQMGGGLAADGNHNNEIDAGDFDVWKAHFGETDGGGTGAGGSAAVPEPQSFAILALGLILSPMGRRPVRTLRAAPL